MSIRIVIADDHKILRDGVRFLLEKQAGMKVVGETGDGRTAVRLSKELSPNVVVMDVAMPDLNGVDATRQIIARSPDIKVIALSMHSERHFVVEMFRAGASGYALKESAFEELETAIHTVIAGKRYLSPNLSDIVIKDYVRLFPGTESATFTSLSPREREVLQLIAEGKSTREIASVLSLSTKTIETHRQQVMEKLNIHSIAELTKCAIREGLTSLES